MSQKVLKRLRQIIFTFLLPSVVMVLSTTNVLAAERQEESPRVIEVDMTEAQPEKSQAVKSLCSGIVPEIVVLQVKDTKVTIPIKQQVTDEYTRYWKTSTLYKWRVNQTFLLKGKGYLPEWFSDSIEVLKKNQEDESVDEIGIETSFTNNEEEVNEEDKTISDEQRAWEYENMKKGPAFANLTWEEFQTQQKELENSEQDDDSGDIEANSDEEVAGTETGLTEEKEKQVYEKPIPIGPGVDEFGNPIPRKEIIYQINKPEEKGPGVVNQEEGEIRNEKDRVEVERQLGDPKEQLEVEGQLGDQKEQLEVEGQLGDQKEQLEVEGQLGEPKEQLEVEGQLGEPKEQLEVEGQPGDPKEQFEVEGQLGDQKEQLEEEKKVAEEVNSVQIGSAKVVYREPITVPNDSEVYMMAQAITAEAGGCGTEEMIYVGIVMKNRRNSNYRSFGNANTIPQVLKQSGQYPTTWRKIQRGLKPTPESLTIAQQLLDGSMAEVYRDGRNLLNGTMLWQTNSRATWATEIFRTPYHYYSISE